MAYTPNTHDRDHVSDYLIPVIHLMVKKRANHTETFKEIAAKLEVTQQTVTDRCSRGINITVPKFVELVKANRIKDHLINKFPHKIDLLNKELAIV